MRYFIASISLIISLCLISFNSKAYTLEFTEAQLQQQLSAMMPVEKSKFIFKLTLSDPVLKLIENTDQFLIKSHIEVTGLSQYKSEGNLSIQSGIRYQPDQGAFYLTNSKIVELDIKNLPPELQIEVGKISQKLTEKLLSRYPIYKLNEDDFKQNLAKMMLKTITIENNKVVLELSPF